MTVLVDEARWRWRGTTWCHLVSDNDLDELHSFAALLGCRRVGFQGDHYDIDVETRDHAIGLGAEPCTSRDLVRRLKVAGLRLVPSSFPKWQLLDRWDPPIDPFQVRGAAGLERLEAMFDQHLEPLLGNQNGWVDGVFALERGESRATIVYGTDFGPPPSENGSIGRYHRVDAAGRWAVEIVDPPLRSVD